MNPIGIFGGTFDPIHNGHLEIAKICVEKLKLQTVRFIPCKIPVHKRDAYASVEQRIAMINLAIAPYPELQLDTRELDRHSASYTVTTLESLREEFDDTPLCFILGSDSFNQLQTWHQWQRLLELCHLIVYFRPGHEIQAESIGPLAKGITNDINELQQGVGSVYILRGHSYPYSATAIREQIRQNQPIDDAVPAAVSRFIQSHQLYHSD